MVCIKGTEKFTSNLSLLLLNDKTSYAFSTKLIEYLLWNVITPKDNIWQNIKRVQEDLYLFQDGVWNNSITSALKQVYENENLIDIDNKVLTLNSAPDCLDSLGYVDTYLEKMISKG